MRAIRRNSVEPTIAITTATPVPLPTFPQQATVELSPTPFITPISTEGYQSPTPSGPVVLPSAGTPGQIPTQLFSTPATQPTGSSGTPVSNPLSTPTALPSEQPCVHTVQSGEYLLSIARKYGVTQDALLAANPQYAGNPNRMAIGDVLRLPNCVTPTTIGATSATGATTVPAGPTHTPGPQVYTVVGGDTLIGISRKFGVTVEAIKAANNLKSDRLDIGQQLVIPAPAQ
jgi:LysM repeat protein